MLVVKIWQGKYYTTITRLREAHSKGLIDIEEKEGLKYYKFITGQLIHCTAIEHALLIEIPPNARLK